MVAATVGSAAAGAEVPRCGVKWRTVGLVMSYRDAGGPAVAVIAAEPLRDRARGSWVVVVVVVVDGVVVHAVSSNLQERRDQRPVPGFSNRQQQQHSPRDAQHSSSPHRPGPPPRPSRAESSAPAPASPSPSGSAPARPAAPPASPRGPAGSFAACGSHSAGWRRCTAGRRAGGVGPRSRRRARARCARRPFLPAPRLGPG